MDFVLTVTKEMITTVQPKYGNLCMREKWMYIYTVDLNRNHNMTRLLAY